MDLASMIRSAVNYSSKNETDRKYKSEQLQKIADERRGKARDKYRRLMEGKGWMTKPMIEKGMGYTHGCCNTAIDRLVLDGYVDKRPLNGEPFNRRKGWEFMWIEEEENNQD